MRLTKPNLAKLELPPGKSETIVFDDALPGFGIRIRAGGKRVWKSSKAANGRRTRGAVTHRRAWTTYI